MSETNQPKSKKSLRDLLVVGLPVAAAALAQACGKSGFGGSKSVGSARKPAAGEVNAQGVVTAPSAQNQEPIEGAPAASDGDQLAKGIESIVPTGALIPVSPSTPPVATPVNPNSAEAKGGKKIPYKLYGKKTSSMLVLKHLELKAGDFVRILSPIKDDNCKGQVLARKRLATYDVGKPVIFDGMNMQGVEEVYVIVARGEQQLAAGPIGVKDADFSVTFRPPGGAVDLPLVDPLSLQGDDRYQRKGAHGNYETMAAAMTFVAPSSPHVTNKKQSGHTVKNTSGVETSSKPFKVAEADSTWTMGAKGIPSTTYFVCDAFGDEIVAGKKFMDTELVSNLLRNHNNLIVYVFDSAGGDHYHRYFFHI